MELPAVLTVDDVMNLLRCHRTTVYRLIKHGQIAYFRIGNSYRFNRVHIEAMMRGESQQAAK